MQLHPRTPAALAAALLLLPAATAQCPQGMFLASDGEDLLNYGSDIAIDGDQALVGAAGHVLIDGRGYVLRRVGGQWSEEAILDPSDDAPNSLAAAAVALSGDVAVIGAPTNDTDAIGNSGAVYVFERIGGSWVETAKLKEPTVQPNNRFGTCLLLDGDRLLIGAPEAGAGNRGLVYVFEKGATWAAASVVGTLSAQDASNNDWFGTSMDLDGDWLAVGAVRADTSVTDAGAVYLFERPAGGFVTATSDAKLTAALPDPFDRLGESVTIRGDRVLGGAPGDAANDKGVVFSWDRVGGTWTDATENGSMRPDIVGGQGLGRSVALIGDVAYAGGTSSFTGLVWRFLWDGTAWVDGLPISPPDAQSGEVYGSALALDGSELWVGASNHRVNNARVGAVHRITPRFADNYCTGAPNSDGGGAHVSACGSTSLASNDLLVVVSGGIKGLPGLFFYGASQTQVPFGDGFLCISAPVFRLFPPINCDSAGGYHYQLDVTSPPASQGPGTITAGSTWNFQFWYRDPQGSGGLAFNLSDAMTVTFTP